MVEPFEFGFLVHNKKQILKKQLVFFLNQRLYSTTKKDIYNLYKINNKAADLQFTLYL